EFCTVICQDVKGVEINGIRIEESAVWGSKNRPYVRPLSVRSICPRALMKSDDRDPYQPRELFADDNRRVVPGLRWRPCRSSRLIALAKLEPVSLLCEPSLRRRAAFLMPSRTSRCVKLHRSSSSPRGSGRAC